MLKAYLKFLYYLFFRKPKTFSQTGEDRIVDFYLGNLKTGFYVDIGANDPVYQSNTYLFYKKGWSGVCVEPNILQCGLIKMVRPRDKVLNIGLGPVEGTLDFYILDPDTLSTFSENEAKRLKDLGHKTVKVKKVPVKTLAQVFKDINHSVDFLSIDTEGMDLEILKSNDWQKYRPKILVVETIEYHGNRGVRTNKLYDKFMAERGYIKLADTYINGIYVEKDFANSKKLENILYA